MKRRFYKPSETPAAIERFQNLSYQQTPAEEREQRDVSPQGEAEDIQPSPAISRDTADEELPPRERGDETVLNTEAGSQTNDGIPDITAKETGDEKDPADIIEKPEIRAVTEWKKPAKPEAYSDVFTQNLIEYEVALHGFLIDRIDLSAIDHMNRGDLQQLLTPLVREFASRFRLVLAQKEFERLVSNVANELKGLGPIEPLLADSTVSDILVNGPSEIYVERKGKLERTQIRFKDEEHLMRIINRIVGAVGRRIDESSPLVDARLLDGSRVNVAVRPITLDGPALSIRKFSDHKLSLFELIKFGSLTHEMAVFLAICVAGRVSMLVSGGTGSGKTTLLNALSSAVPHSERLITIEDAAELKLQQPHVVRMETRPRTVEGQQAVAQSDLVRNALRMRPDRIILGEVRGDEAYDMVQAMNTGHEGSLSTIHANSPRDALSRLEQMVSMRSQQLTLLNIRRQIVSSIRVIVQAQRFSDGSRRIVSIAEITGMEGEVVQIDEVYRYEQDGIDRDGHIVGRFLSSERPAQVLSKLRVAGLTMQSHLNDLVGE